jgi:hypothetical protein
VEATAVTFNDMVDFAFSHLKQAETGSRGVAGLNTVGIKPN